MALVATERFSTAGFFGRQVSGYPFVNVCNSGGSLHRCWKKWKLYMSLTFFV